MKIERTKNASRNIVFGILLKIYQIAVPFLMRTAMIYFMGVQYLGLNSLFTSILQVLNLTELGVGSAMVFSMYKPIAEDDVATICALMRLYRLYYRTIGLLIAIIGGALTPFIPYLIKGELPAGLNIYFLYILNLTGTVLSYWLFAYKNALFQAHQRVDVTSIISLFTSTIQYAIQLVVLIFIKDYYLYVLAALFTQVLTNIVTAISSNIMFPNYHPEGLLPKEEVRKINQRIKDLFTAKLGGTITNSADTIVISAFLGLTQLAIYQNYYFIMNSVCGFISIVFSSITAGIGNSLVTESKEKNYQDFKVLSFIICFILCICCGCFIALYQPFVTIWVGSKFLLSFNFVILFCILFYCLELAMLWATIKDAAGIWHQDRYRPFIGALVNLGLNLFFVRFIGLYGIVLSTLFSYIFISMPWLLHNLLTLVYKEGVVSYLKNITRYVLIAIISSSMVYIVCHLVKCNGFWGLIVYFIIGSSIPTAIQIFSYRHSIEYMNSIKLIKRIISRR